MTFIYPYYNLIMNLTGLTGSNCKISKHSIKASLPGVSEGSVCCNVKTMIFLWLPKILVT